MTSPNAVHQGLRAVVARRATAALALVLLAASPAPSRQTDRMPDEAIRQWRAYLDRLASHPGMTVEVDVDAQKDGKPIGEPQRLRIMVRPGAVSADNARLENPNHGHVVTATNRDYGFRIGRKRADAPWVLVDASPNTGTGQFWEAFPAREAAESVYKSGLMLAFPGEALPDLVGDKEFVVTRVAKHDEGGESLTRVEFRNTPRDVRRVTDATSTRPPRQIDVVSGHVLLDPKRYWLIHSFAARLRPASADQKGQFLDVIGTHTYRPLRDGLPVVERVEHRIQLTSSGSATVTTAIFRYDETVPAAGDFRLPKYGLPEPFGFGRPTRWYLWAIAAAAVLFAAAVYFRRLASRRTVATH
ncbi:MAG: hypothetical protein U0746_03675 [Gemmataceae bacterium]